MNNATLYIFAGLPGTGKSTMARMLSTHMNCTFLRIDTVEQALRDLCAVDVTGEGYQLAYRLAADNLRIGHNVVADSCNPIALTRRDWLQVASDEGCQAINIEVVCTDVVEHQRRVENRPGEVAGLILPTWKHVVEREYDLWDRAEIQLDTAGSSPAASFDTLLTMLGADKLLDTAGS